MTYVKGNTSKDRTDHPCRKKDRTHSRPATIEIRRVHHERERSLSRVCIYIIKRETTYQLSLENI